MWPAVDIPGQWVYVASACVFVLLSAGACWRGWRYDRARGRPRCYKCGYPVAPDDAQAVTEAVGRAPCQQKAKRPRGSTREPGGSAAHASRAGCLSNQPKGAGAGKTEGGSGPWACPECGWVPRRVKDLTRTRRSRRWLAVSLLLLIGATSCWYAIHVQFRRYKLQEPLTTAAVPTTWWLLVLPQSSGDEDMILFHRAYPQAKVTNGLTVMQQLPGSGRQYPASVVRTGRYAVAISARGSSRSELPEVQQGWAVAGFRHKMQDSHRPSQERVDAAWMYFQFTGLDDPKDIEAYIGLLSDRDPELTLFVIGEFMRCRSAQDQIADACVFVAEDAGYSQLIRQRACAGLVAHISYGERHIIRWINDEDPQVRQLGYTAITALYSHGVRYNSDEGYRSSRHRILRAYFASEYAAVGPEPADWLTAEMSTYWRGAINTHVLYAGFEEDIAAYLSDHPIRYALLQEGAYRLATVVHNTHDHWDHRAIDAWLWLLSDGAPFLRRRAAEKLRYIAEQCVGHESYKIPARDYLRPRIEAELLDEVDPKVHVELQAAIDSLGS